jgi:small subunit ribosomal protein S2
MGVAVVSLIDTDSDPDTVDLPIPGNDDSIRSIELILSKLADSVLEGRASLSPDAVPQPGQQPRPRREPREARESAPANTSAPSVVVE